MDFVVKQNRWRAGHRFCLLLLLSLQLFVLQMDETVVSTGQGRGSALLV